MGLTNTESVSKHKVQFSWPRKLRILCTLSWWAKCSVTWYGHSYLSTATCYRLAGAGVLLPSAAKSALSFKFDTTSGLITHNMRPWCFLEPCLNRANFLCLFHCSLTVTTIVKLCVTILRPEWELGAGSVSCHVSPSRLLSGDWALTGPSSPGSWQMSLVPPSLGSLTTDHWAVMWASRPQPSKISANLQ